MDFMNHPLLVAQQAALAIVNGENISTKGSDAIYRWIADSRDDATTELIEDFKRFFKLYQGWFSL